MASRPKSLAAQDELDIQVGKNTLVNESHIKKNFALLLKNRYVYIRLHYSQHLMNQWKIALLVVKISQRVLPWKKDLSGDFFSTCVVALDFG
uniref:Uncharacterized protein n=1 Tax=Solanum lycopersicum TaxID=4081 RepID=A0A3Q7G9J0_SOLLC